MTVTTTDRIAIYRGNGIATVFPFDFIIPESENLSVSLYDFATGELIEVIAPGAYSVVGLGEETGGTVTYPLTGAPVPNTQNVVILRTMPFTQETNIRNQGGFFPEIIETQLDAIVMQIQQLAEVQSRSMVVNPGQDVPDISVIESAEQFALNAQASAVAAAASEAAAQASEDAAEAAAQAAVAAGVVIAEFTFSTATTYPPATGGIRLNNATQNSATQIYVSHMTARGVDLTNIIPLVFAAGGTVLIQDANVIGNYKIYTISSPPVLSGGDFQIPVVFKSGGASLVNGSVFTTLTGGGGAGATYVGDTPPPQPLQNGQLWFKSSTGVFYTYYNDGNSTQWVQVSAAPQTTAPNTRNRGYIDPGMELLNDTTDATNDIVFPSGVVASEVFPYPLLQHTQTIRQVDVVFETNNTDRFGGRFSSAAVTDGTWHCFIISNGTLTKSGFSKNANPTADDLYPAGYTHYRRIGSWQRESGIMVPLRQDGNHFWRITAKTDYSSVANRAAALLTLSVPLGIKTTPIMSLSASITVVSSSVTVLMADGNASTTGMLIVGYCFTLTQVNVASADSKTIAGPFQTNLAAQIMFRVDVAGTVNNNALTSYGWIDTRGRN